MKTSDFDYTLPPELIAQTPLEPRDHSRLMVLDRRDGSLQHRHFVEIIDYFKEGDVLIFNNSRVIPGRLFGKRADTGGKVELLLLRRLETATWEALAKPGKSLRPGSEVRITGPDGKETAVTAGITAQKPDGIKVVKFSDETLLPQLGKVPLPPYIHRPLANPERYQTVYSKISGSVAAPTAGLHFTRELLGQIEQKGVQCRFVTLHVGLDTFQPVREDDPTQHVIHREYAELSQEVADVLGKARQEGRRIIAVGTTTARILEHAAKVSHAKPVELFSGWVDLFILPGYRFQMIDALVTNFHLPRSTLLMLVTAFAGKELIARAYQEAIVCKYRFYSFGDATLIL